MGLILGRKVFQRPMKDGVQIINAMQDVYLSKEGIFFRQFYQVRALL